MARSRRGVDVSGNCGDGQAAEPINQRRRHAQRTAPNVVDGSEQNIENPGQGSEPNVGGGSEANIRNQDGMLQQLMQALIGVVQNQATMGPQSGISELKRLAPPAFKWATDLLESSWPENPCGKGSTSHVPETTRNDIGLEEEWSDLSSHNTEVAPVNRQPSSYEGVPGFQQYGQKSLHEHGERLQMDSTHRSIPKSSEEGSKWLSRVPLQKPLAEGIQIYGDAAYSLDAEMTPKSTSGFCANQQKVSSHNFSQPQYKPNDCNVGETVALRQDAVLKTHENGNKFQHLPEKMSHGGHVWKAKAGPNSTMGLEHGMSLMGSSQVNREDSSSNNLAAIPNSCTGMASQETSQLLPKTMKVHYLQGYMLDLQGNEKEVDDAPPKGTPPGFTLGRMFRNYCDGTRTEGAFRLDKMKFKSNRSKRRASRLVGGGGVRAKGSHGRSQRSLEGGAGADVALLCNFGGCGGLDHKTRGDTFGRSFRKGGSNDGWVKEKFGRFSKFVWKEEETSE
ncbi:hypothetical protein Acr_26g0002980 [Actinidia rufa]|uniref:Uncharacterized protein n=1 Tax=Actinidia rufa TaxID=165716 RepID=A0A7J0H1Y7_9ERIC|nr:hypothetical protein Acr_26g0002980 [Actinidia rufa]